MVIISSYTTAVILCVVTMLCWGSWANTLKLAKKDWAYSLYYWDYSIGVVLLALLFGLTLGSTGQEGQEFFENFKTASLSSYGNALLGGVIFNLSNLLIVAATAIAGMSVAFPIAVGLALVIGVLDNYIRRTEGDPTLLFAGVALIVLAILINSVAYRKHSRTKEGSSSKGIILSVLSGSIMGFFFGFVAKTLPADFSEVTTGSFTPYNAVFVFSIGIFLSNFIFNTWFMYNPVSGEKVSYSQYFSDGNLQASPDWDSWRSYMEYRHVFQYPRVRCCRSGNFLWPRPGSYDDCSRLGCFCMEGIQRCRQNHKMAAYRHVWIFYHRTCHDNNCKRSIKPRIELNIKL